ncbi:MAG: hypothetical protein WB561_23100 [Terracidiphilus sp.]
MRESPRAPSQFEILCRVFWLRVVDLEVLSPDNDAQTLLGHLAALLAGVSVLFTAPIILIGGPMAEPDLWTFEHLFFTTTLTVVGVLSVLSWDSSLPDRRDLLVLGPLPIRTRTVFAAKLSSLAGVLSFSVVALNFSSGLIWPMLFRASGSGFLGAARSLIAYWAVTGPAAIFIFSCVLCLQGIAALILSRQLFLRLSSLLQVLAFTTLFGVYLLEPPLESVSALSAPANQRYLHFLPSYWFLGLFQQLNGTMRPAFNPLADRAWYALACAPILAVVLLMLSWLMKLRRAVEQPDVTPDGGQSWRWPEFSGVIPEAIVQFSARSLLRSPQHRLLYAFYLSVGFATVMLYTGLPEMHGYIAEGSAAYVGASLMLLCIAVLGLRMIISVPVILRANWIFQLTQIHTVGVYFSASRKVILVLAVVPIWIVVAAVMFCAAPSWRTATHLTALACIGAILADLAVVSLRNIPFTCSYLPGKAQLHFVFWGGMLLGLPLISEAASIEWRLLASRLGSISLVVCVSLAAILIRWGTNSRLRKADSIIFREEATPDLLSLKLGS